MPNQPATADQNKGTPNDALLYTNPLLNDDTSAEGVRAVLALLTYLDLSDVSLGDEGNHGLILVHEWLRRSMAYSGHKNEQAIAIPASRAMRATPMPTNQSLTR